MPTNTQPKLSLIVAMARNRVIGLDGKIPWHLPNELKLFKSLTMGHPIIMGRKTYESINRLLPGRTTHIVSRQTDYSVAGAHVSHSLSAAIANAAAQEPENQETFVIGGGELYRAALPLADRLYLTVVAAEPAGDTLMPELDLSDWQLQSAQEYAPDDRHAYAYRFELYERQRSPASSF
jgi:dihydrofolate reductase